MQMGSDDAVRYGPLPTPFLTLAHRFPPRLRVAGLGAATALCSCEHAHIAQGAQPAVGERVERRTAPPAEHAESPSTKVLVSHAVLSSLTVLARCLVDARRWRGPRVFAARDDVGGLKCASDEQRRTLRVLVDEAVPIIF